MGEVISIAPGKYGPKTITFFGQVKDASRQTYATNINARKYSSDKVCALYKDLERLAKKANVRFANEKLLRHDTVRLIMMDNYEDDEGNKLKILNGKYGRLVTHQNYTTEVPDNRWKVQLHEFKKLNLEEHIWVHRINLEKLTTEEEAKYDEEKAKRQKEAHKKQEQERRALEDKKEEQRQLKEIHQMELDNPGCELYEWTDKDGHKIKIFANSNEPKESRIKFYKSCQEKQYLHNKDKFHKVDHVRFVICKGELDVLKVRWTDNSVTTKRTTDIPRHIFEKIFPGVELNDDAEIDFAKQRKEQQEQKIMQANKDKLVDYNKSKNFRAKDPCYNYIFEKLQKFANQASKGVLVFESVLCKDVEKLAKIMLKTFMKGEHTHDIPTGRYWDEIEDEAHYKGSRGICQAGHEEILSGYFVQNDTFRDELSEKLRCIFQCVFNKRISERVKNKGLTRCLSEPAGNLESWDTRYARDTFWPSWSTKYMKY